jgi:hypothetical protein
VPTVRVATLLNAIPGELTHLAPCRPGMAPPYDAPRDARSSMARTLVELYPTSGVTFPAYLRSPGARLGLSLRRAQ